MSDYEFILDEMTFSFSNLSSFYQCKHEWYLHYIESEDKVNNIYAEYGSFCHKILEMYYSGELNKDQLIEYYDEYFNEKNEKLMLSSSYDKYYEAGKEYFANLDLERDTYEIIGVEKECKWEINRHKFIGYIDLLLKDGDDLIILDHKSAEFPYSKAGKLKKGQIDKHRNYLRQLYIYADYVKKEYGEFPKYLVWNYFRNRKYDKIEFNIEDYNEAMDWAKNTIQAIYKENEFADKQEFFYCSRLCNYRNVCECNN